MKKLIVFVCLPLLAGCVSWNNKASLTTKFNNASQSIQDLANSETKEIIDSETDQSIKFYYQDEANQENLKKITSTRKLSPSQKEVINLYIQDGDINLANLEIHNVTKGYTDLQNHSYTVENNQVKEIYKKGNSQNDSLDEVDQEDSIPSQINQHIQYIISTYLN